MSRRVGISLAVIVAAVCAPPAAAAKPKLYSVALSGDARHEVIQVLEDAVEVPFGCQGSMSETRRFVASAGLTPKPRPAPVASHARLRFRSVLTNLTATSTSETTGSFSPDPFLPPDDPSACSVAPVKKSYPCRLHPEATRKSGAEFALFPDKGRYQLYYNRSAGILSCDDDMYLSLMDVSVAQRTKLRVRSVKRLKKGRSVSASGTLVTPQNIGSSTTGAHTWNYALKVTRVR